MADDWSRRRDLLTPGAACVARRDAPAAGGATFIRGERLVLRHVAYSRYDGAHVYAFEDETGALKAFWLGDEQPVEALTDTFA